MENYVNPINLESVHIMIVGDIMLDRYWFGEVNRISPEAPVPIIKVEKKEERLGGAANVARNVASLSANACLLGIIGHDEAGNEVENLLKKSGISTYLHRDASISTIVKLRLIGRQQQLLRVDFEAPPAQTVLDDKMTQYKQLLANYDVVVLSDYAKGSLTHVADMISIAKKAGKPVLIDPKGDDFTPYIGATMLTPNKAELRHVVGSWKNEEDLARRAQALREELKLKYLLLTRSEEGMSLYSADGIIHIPTQAQEIYDVSGAGDTVIATVATMLGAGKKIEDAISIANRAAGIVVNKLGTATVSQEELFSKKNN